MKRLFPPSLGRVVNGDLLGALVLLAIAAVSLSQMGSDMRNWGFPQLVTYTLLGISVVLGVRGLRRLLSSAPPESRDPARRKNGLDVAVSVTSIVVYVIMIPVAGFWLASFLAFTCGAFFLGPRRGRREAVSSVSIAAVVCAGGYILFTRVFFVSLPAGVLIETIR